MPAAPAALQTARLTLRAWRLDDAPALRATLDDNDAHLRPWIPFMAQEPRSMTQTRAWMRSFIEDFAAGRHWRYALWRRGEEPLVGEAMLLGRGGPGTLEVGYWLDRHHVGRGYATEAVQALVELGFGALGAERLLFRCDVENGPSNALPERLGADRAGVERLEDGVRLQAWVLTPGA